MAVMILEEVPAIQIVGEDSAGVVDARYRSCDFCYQTAVEDIWAGKRDESEWRKFYELHTGEIVCEHCLPGVE